MFGDKTDPSSIEGAPKQSWGSLIKSRLSAFGVVFLTFTTAASAVPKTFGAFANEFGHKFTKWFKAKPYGPGLDPELLKKQALLSVTEGEAAAKELKVVGEAIAKHETWQFQMGKIASWDTIATTAAVILLYAGSKFFAKKREEKKHADAAPVNDAPKQQADVTPQLQRQDAPKVKEQPETPRAEIIAESVSAEKAMANAAPNLGA